MSKKLTMRQHKIKALKCAKDFLIKKYVNLGLGYGICFALNVHSYSSGHKLAVYELKKYINEALGTGQVWLNDWVYTNCNVKSRPSSIDPKMFNTRIAWIDWMINCLEEDERNEHK